MGIDEITNSGKDYDTEFWNKAMRGKSADFEKLKGGHRDIRMRDSEDIVELFNLFGLSLEPRKDIEV